MNRVLAQAALLIGATFVNSASAQEVYIGRVAPWITGGYVVTVGAGAADIFHPPNGLLFEDTGPDFQFRLTFDRGLAQDAIDFANAVCRRLGQPLHGVEEGAEQLTFRCR